MIKKAIFLICFITPSLLFSSQNREETIVEKQKPTISLAHSWGYKFKNQLNDFKNKVSDDFIIEAEENLGLNLKQKILIDISSNTLPDVFCFWSYETNLKYLANNGFILDIDEYFKETNLFSRSDFYEDSLKSTEINGINYGIPHERFFGYFAVNQAILKKYNLNIPKSWDDLKNMAPILEKDGLVPLSMGSFRGDPGHLFFSALTYQQSKGYEDTLKMKENGNFIYPGTQLATQAVIDLVNNNIIPKNTIFEGSFERQVELYNNKKVATIFSFSWSLALIDNEIAKDTLIIPIPKINNSDTINNNFTIGGTAQSILINKKSWEDLDKRESIIKLVDWLLSDEVFISKQQTTGSYPAKKMVIPKNENPIFEKATNYIEKTQIYGIHEFYFNSLNSFNIYKEANDLLWSGSISGNDFLQMVQDGMVQDGMVIKNE